MFNSWYKHGVEKNWFKNLEYSLWIILKVHAPYPDRRNIAGEPSQWYGCWCPGSLHNQQPWYCPGMINRSLSSTWKDFNYLRHSNVDKWKENLFFLSAEDNSAPEGLSDFILGSVSVSDKTSHSKISWSLEAARFVFRIFQSLWNFTCTSAALLPMCLSNFKAMRYFELSIAWFRDFQRSYDKTSYRILKQGPITVTS